MAKKKGGAKGGAKGSKKPLFGRGSRGGGG
jgi:hypothetical protein